MSTSADSRGLTHHESPNMFGVWLYPGRAENPLVVMLSKNPLHVVLHQQVGIDSFALDGDDTDVADPWQDRPARCHTQARA